jgi:Ca2+-binding RTX toxin-like protein
MIGIANIPGENIQYKIVAISDTNNTITLEPLLNGTPDAGTQTDFALGFNSTGMLISPNNEATVAGEYTSGNAPIADSLLSILSSAPIVSGTTETYTKAGSTGGGGNPQQPPASSLTVSDTTTGKPDLATVMPYSGPVAGLTSEFISTSADSLNITATAPGFFIHGGSGNDGIQVSSGINVLDGGTGSNFLVGGTGTDTFFVDDRGPTSDIWSTVSNFHAGDDLTLWGINQSDFTLSWVDGQGATGFTGLTMHATAAGKPTASFTLSGFTTADRSNGKLTISLGTDPASGSAYMVVHDNS